MLTETRPLWRNFSFFTCLLDRGRFIVAQYVSFLITRQEQTVLIEWYFRAVVIECGVMMMKRLAEVIVGRIKKKEKIDITESEDTNNDY